MGILDHVFRLVFARYHRETGNRSVDSAWRSATNKVCGYLVLPVAAALIAPPALPAEESSAETRFLFWFRAIGAFAATCVLGFLLRRAGAEFLQGL